MRSIEKYNKWMEDEGWKTIRFNTLRSGEVVKYHSKMMTKVYFWTISMNRHELGMDFKKYWGDKADRCYIGRLLQGDKVCLLVYMIFQGDGISVGDFAIGSKDVAIDITFRRGYKDDIEYMENASHMELEFQNLK